MPLLNQESSCYQHQAGHGYTGRLSISLRPARSSTPTFAESQRASGATVPGPICQLARCSVSVLEPHSFQLLRCSFICLLVNYALATGTCNIDSSSSSASFHNKAVPTWGHGTPEFGYCSFILGDFQLNSAICNSSSPQRVSILGFRLPSNSLSSPRPAMGHPCTNSTSLVVGCNMGEQSQSCRESSSTLSLSQLYIKP